MFSGSQKPFSVREPLSTLQLTTARTTDTFVPASTRTATSGTPTPSCFLYYSMPVSGGGERRRGAADGRGYAAVSKNAWGTAANQRRVISPTVQPQGPLLLIYSAGPVHPAGAQSTPTPGVEAQLKTARGWKTDANMASADCHWRGFLANWAPGNAPEARNRDFTPSTRKTPRVIF